MNYEIFFVLFFFREVLKAKWITQDEDCLGAKKKKTPEKMKVSKNNIKLVLTYKLRFIYSKSASKNNESENTISQAF